MHHDPENGDLKDNKVELLARVKNMEFVKAAMSTYETNKKQV